MSEEAKPTELLPLVTDIVAAHLSNNNVPSAELPQLIRDVYHALAAASGGGPAPLARPEAAVPVKKSVTPDYIVCLEDGKKLKMLKRHLRTAYDMSPEQYRERWDLPADYPMVAPNYAKQRSKLAKAIGLGTRPRQRARLTGPSKPLSGAPTAKVAGAFRLNYNYPLRDDGGVKEHAFAA